jgi:hypothetical protein
MPPKLTREILTAAIAGFEEQKKQLDSQIAELRQMLNPAVTNGAGPAPTKARRKMSAAQRKRWAESKTESSAESKVIPTPPRKKRKLSAAGRRAIIEATKRRWAKVQTAGTK